MNLQEACKFKCSKIVNPGCFQDDLYGVNQPALFLLDAKYQLWLWQGWFETSEDSETVTGSARHTFARNKKVAMETVNNYVEGKFTCVKRGSTRISRARLTLAH